MNTLIIKLGAAGDVVRTTTLLSILDGNIDWLADDTNAILLKGIAKINRIIKWSDRTSLAKRYDLIINLEDSIDVAKILSEVEHKDLYGSYIDSKGKLTYSENSRAWFDISLISRFGLEKANKLKLNNRKSFQELIFTGLERRFKGEPYFLPDTDMSDLAGDIAIASMSGDVWPMKNWAFFHELADSLINDGYRVNFLPKRRTMLEHLADIRNHKYLISGDSLPMHFAIGSRIKCLTIFICTSPWEIHGYEVQRKVISSQLEKYFYRRDVDKKASTSISLETVYNEFVKLTKV